MTFAASSIARARISFKTYDNAIGVLVLAVTYLSMLFIFLMRELYRLVIFHRRYAKDLWEAADPPARDEPLDPIMRFLTNGKCMKVPAIRHYGAFRTGAIADVRSPSHTRPPRRHVASPPHRTSILVGLVAGPG